MMTTAEPMTARGAHYTALLETIDHQGATKLHTREREQLLEAADTRSLASLKTSGYVDRLRT